PLHALLSLIVPGLGQFVAKARTRGLTILLMVVTLIGLSMWTIAQRARFPDYSLSTAVFIKVVLATAALLVFLLALRHLFVRFVTKDPAMEAFSLYGVVILFFLLLVVIGPSQILPTVLRPEEISQV